ncbi:hypothetical protein [Arthrobacter glacialis]|uniref:hypothetical protein n=1 Tax=Arthrobacter glacialis TaxID=1664 RepID=UPI000CD3E8C4|nr:hypothetical protein [Arthrobacter glacialis]POH58259.1 hypothetical protein CVS28_12515 [Arthrobacter glacialis]
MNDFSGIPRAFDPRQAKREREEFARLAEQRSSARNTSSTTIGSGGRLDLDGGDLDIFNGGKTRVRDGGSFRVEGGGSMDIVDDGQINVIGQGQELLTQEPVTVRASMANRPSFNSWVGAVILKAGLYFGLTESRGDRDPRVASSDGLGVEISSAFDPLQYGPQAGPNIVSESSAIVRPGSAYLGTNAWDDAINPGGGSGLAGHKGFSYIYMRPHDMSIWLGNQTGGTTEIPDGLALSISGTLEDAVLELYGRNGVNVQGSFTVNGLPITAPVTSVAGKTGAVTLVKGDVGLGSVDNTSDAAKPVSTATATALSGKAATVHTHSITDVTGLQTALNGKAATTHTHPDATTSAAGFMSAADKTRLDASAAPARFKNQPITLGSGPYAGNSINNIGLGINIPANPYGAGVGYKIDFVGQVIAIAGAAGGICQAVGKVNGNGFNTSYTPRADVAGRLLTNLNIVSVLVPTGAASTVTYEWTPLYNNTTTLSTNATDTYFQVTISPYIAL